MPQLCILDVVGRNLTDVRFPFHVHDEYKVHTQYDPQELMPGHQCMLSKHANILWLHVVLHIISIFKTLECKCSIFCQFLYMQWLALFFLFGIVVAERILFGFRFPPHVHYKYYPNAKRSQQSHKSTEVKW